MPFLEILTRCHPKRPTLGERNKTSVDALKSRDWVQTLLRDTSEKGRGVQWANRALGNYAPDLEGDYIWILDDDDECIYPALIADLKRIVKTHDPDLIMVKADCGEHGIVPSEETWKRSPQLTRVGMSSFVVRRAVWQAHADAFPHDLAGDFAFISAVYAATPPERVYWHDVIVMRTMQKGGGRGE